MGMLHGGGATAGVFSALWHLSESVHCGIPPMLPRLCSADRLLPVAQRTSLPARHRYRIGTGADQYPDS